MGRQRGKHARAHRRIPGAPTPFPEADVGVARLDPASVLTLASIPLPRAPASAPPGSYQIAVGPQGVWVIDADGSVSRIDPASNRLVQTVPDVNVSAIASGAEGTWAVEQNTSTGSVVQLTADRGAVRHVRIPAVQLATSLSSIAVGAGAVWVTDPQSGLLWRIDPGPVPVEPIPLAPGASDVAYGADAVWVANGLTGTVSRVDPRTNQVTQTVAVGNTPGRLIADRSGVWVAVAGTNGVTVPAAAQTRTGIDALPASVCGPVLSAGDGPPQRLLVSDFPLHGGPGVPSQQMSAAIAFVLREHRFRAGRWRLGYQACDDSTATTGVPDPHKCASNANAWIQHPLVIGVIGPYSSSCAISEIAITNQTRAAGDPLADEQLRRAHPPRPARATRGPQPALPDRRAQLRARLSRGRPRSRRPGPVHQPAHARQRLCAPRPDRFLQPGQRHLLPDRRPPDRPAPRRIGHLEPTIAHLRSARPAHRQLGRDRCVPGPRRRRSQRRSADPRIAPAARAPDRAADQLDSAPRRTPSSTTPDPPRTA